jgi:PAS domain S-box-containing protein
VRLLPDGVPSPRPQPGVLLYVPVYRGGGVPATTAQRRDALRGFAFGVLRVHDLLNSIFSGQSWDIDFEIYDGDEANESTLLYRSASDRRLLDEVTSARLLAHCAALEIAGRRWLLLASPTPQFLSAADQYQHWLVAAGGVAINVLFGVGLWASSAMRKRAQVLAEGMAEAVRDSETQTQLMVDSISDHAIFGLDADMNVASWNPAAARMLGCDESDALGRPAARFWVGADGNPYLDGSAERHTKEGWHTRKDGHRFWGAVAIAPLRRAEGSAAGWVVILRDDTKHRQALEALAETSAALEQRTVALGRFNRLAAGRELRMIELKRMVNERAARLGEPPPFDLSFTGEFADVLSPGGEAA